MCRRCRFLDGGRCWRLSHELKSNPILENREPTGPHGAFVPVEGDNKADMSAQRQSLPDPPPTLAPPSSPELENETNDNVTGVVVTPEDFGMLPSSTNPNNNGAADAEENVPTHSHTVTNESDGQDGLHPLSSSEGIILDAELAPDVETEVHRFMAETIGTSFPVHQEAARAIPVQREHGTEQGQGGIVIGSLIGIEIDTNDGNSTAVERHDGHSTEYNNNDAEDKKKNRGWDMFFYILVSLFPVAIIVGIIMLLSRNPEKDIYSPPPSPLPSSNPTTTTTNPTTTSPATATTNPTIPNPTTTTTSPTTTNPATTNPTTGSAATRRPTASPKPSLYPTASLSPTPADNWISLLRNKLNISNVDVSPVNSAKRLAFEWMAYSDSFRNELLLATDNSFWERYAVILLYFTTNGPLWANRYNFLSDAPTCIWNNGETSNRGIHCSDNGEVVSILLSGNELRGSIPSELGLLSALTLLYLHSNQIIGSIPSELGSLTSLQSLVLYSNQLGGTIPSELWVLTTLTRLDLGDNDMSGILPSELGFLSALSYLDLSYNQLTGSIPSELGLLTTLSTIWLGYNVLTGRLPSEVGLLNKLTFLHLDDNRLTGSIPSEVGLLTSLTLLELSRSELIGMIPSELGSLSDLRILLLRNNGLTGRIPPELGLLTSLEHLHLSSNELTGTIPSELGLLTKLSLLNLCDNQLTGTVPPELNYTTIWCPP